MHNGDYVGNNCCMHPVFMSMAHGATSFLH